MNDLFSVVVVVNTAFTVAGNRAERTRRRAVAGSMERYRWASMERMWRILSASGWLLGSVAMWVVAAHPAAGVFAVRCVLDSVVVFKSKDDDDWFTRTGRKIRRAARRAVQSLSTTPVPAAAA